MDCRTDSRTGSRRGCRAGCRMACRTAGLPLSCSPSSAPPPLPPNRAGSRMGSRVENRVDSRMGNRKGRRVENRAENCMRNRVGSRVGAHGKTNLGNRMGSPVGIPHGKTACLNIYGATTTKSYNSQVPTWVPTTWFALGFPWTPVGFAMNNRGMRWTSSQNLTASHDVTRGRRRDTAGLPVDHRGESQYCQTLHSSQT